MVDVISGARVMTETGAAVEVSKESLSVRDLGLIYQTSAGPIEALRGVSLDVRDGEFISIIGPSGCGKSSLLKLVLGLQDATRGDIRIAGVPVKGPSRNAGCVFQSPVLLPWRTILENVLLPVDVMKIDRTAAMDRASELLKLVGLGGFETRYPFELSGGMQQRAAIVRALVHDPRLLIMDEPFAALDALTREQMSAEVQRIWLESGKTIVFITHSINEAVFLSDRIIVMSARPGRIVAEYKNPYPRPRTFADMGSPELASLMTEIRESLDRASAT
jgi:NitT/TauT family transport system ATP-binding protein